MKDGIDMIKLKEYAVINLNNMFPVPENEYEYIDISAVKDLKYKNLLIAEYRYILHIQNRIKQNAKNIYTIKMRDGDSTPLSKRCHNFKILEEACDNYLRLK